MQTAPHHPPTTAAGAPRHPHSGSPSAPRWMLWTGRIVTGYVALFLLFDGGARIARFAPYVEGLTKFGYAEELGVWIGLTLVISTVLYLLPRTAVLGAILLTGYLGGAAASQVRMGDPWFLFAVSFGVLVWVGLCLRDPDVRVVVIGR